MRLDALTRFFFDPAQPDFPASGLAGLLIRPNGTADLPVLLEWQHVLARLRALRPELTRDRVAARDVFDPITAGLRAASTDPDALRDPWACCIVALTLSVARESANLALDQRDADLFGMAGRGFWATSVEQLVRLWDEGRDEGAADSAGRNPMALGFYCLASVAISCEPVVARISGSNGEFGGLKRYVALLRGDTPPDDAEAFDPGPEPHPYERFLRKRLQNRAARVDRIRAVPFPSRWRVAFDYLMHK